MLIESNLNETARKDEKWMGDEHISAMDKYMNNNLELAIYKFRGDAAKFKRAKRYYAGEHDLGCATEKFQTAFGTFFRGLAMIPCSAIMYAVKDDCGLLGPAPTVTFADAKRAQI